MSRGGEATSTGSPSAVAENGGHVSLQMGKIRAILTRR